MKMNQSVKGQKLINPRQICMLLLLCVFGGSTIFIYTPTDLQHSWITYLVSGTGGIILLMIYLMLYKKSGMQPLTTMLYNCLGKIAGTFLSLLYAAFFLFNTLLSLNNYSIFLNHTCYFDTPKTFIITIVCLISTYAIYKGLRVIARASEFFVWMIFIIFSFINFVLMQYVKIENIYPLKNIKIKTILNDSLYPLILLFGAIVVLLVIFPDAGSDKEIKKPLFTGMGIVIAVITIILLRTLLIIGNLISRSTYPIFFAYSVSYPIKFGVFASTIVGLAAIIKVSVFLYASITILTTIFHVKFNRFIIPTVLAAGAGGSFLFKNSIEFIAFIQDIWVYCAAAFEIGIPVILLLIYMIKSSINKIINFMKKDSGDET